MYDFMDFMRKGRVIQSEVISAWTSFLPNFVVPADKQSSLTRWRLFIQLYKKVNLYETNKVLDGSILASHPGQGSHDVPAHSTLGIL